MQVPHATVGVIESVLDQLRQAEARRVRNGLPFVTLSWAQSLDGSIALEPGRRTTLSGGEAMALTHALRAAHDSILVGIGTLLADDPALTVRLWDGLSPAPVVLDSRLRTPPSARLLSAAVNPRAIRICCTEAASAEGRAALEARGATILQLPSWSNGWVDLDELLRRLAAAGVRRVMVEGGAKVLTSFLRSGLGDYVVVTVAPCLLGGLAALGRLEGGRLPRLADARSYRLAEDWVMAGPLAWGVG